MGLEADSERDLSLSEEDAENVVGGLKKNKKTKAKAKTPAKAASHAATVSPAIIINEPPMPSSGDSVDPSTDPATTDPDADC